MTSDCGGCSYTYAKKDKSLRTKPNIKKATNVYRGAFLIAACSILVGSYFCYDMPGVLNRELRQHMEIDLDDWQYKVNLLFSVTSLPNIVFPFISGILIDQIGSKFALTLFTMILCIGHALFALGISLKTFWIMCLGRTLFGIGSGSSEIVQNKLTTDWFRGSLLAFALALNLTFDRWAAAGDAIVSPRLYHYFGNISMVAWFGLGMCLLSALGSSLLIHMDSPRARIQAGVNLENKGNIADGNRKIRFKDILNLKPAFWLLCILAVTLYGSVQPFLYISSDYLQSEKYPGQPETAGTVMSIPSLLSSFGTPLCGLIIDRIGYHGELMTFSALIIMVVHSLLAFTSITPVIPYIMLGLGYSIFAAALWPSVPGLVHERQLGTGIGISVISFNLAITGVPMIIAKIRVWTGNFLAIQVFFIILAFCGFLAGILLCSIQSHTKETNNDDSLESPTSTGEAHDRMPLLVNG
ncbi:hypothetical protein K7432_004027 [Basidiobolus ranarum]|uniref:Lysosomal dipeptide transporter MFSD1 n=1 Tax=Basidiobolus ranarum TaxID=34480 RepID=A0ABR2W584_9FUNG